MFLIIYEDQFDYKLEGTRYDFESVNIHLRNLVIVLMFGDFVVLFDCNL